MKQNEQKIGMMYTLIAYLIWGILPIYWKLIQHVPSGEVLAHRIIWSFVLMIVILIFAKRAKTFIYEFKRMWQNKKSLLGIIAASIIISLNWLTYIWAVQNDYVIEASLGYYINPLISVILAVIFLKERLDQQQRIAVLIAVVGVVFLTFSYGVFPWVSIILAVTFAIYGLVKKLVDIDEMFGLTFETLFITPLALIYLLALPSSNLTAYVTDSSTLFLLIGTGAATAVPLLLFAYGAKRIQLGLLGFMQYISPTIMLFIGIFLYQEPFTWVHFISFACIWTALIIYMGSAYRMSRQEALKHDIAK